MYKDYSLIEILIEICYEIFTAVYLAYIHNKQTIMQEFTWQS